MMANARVDKVNPLIFQQCREQTGLSIEKAQEKAGVKTLGKIETGKTKPTFNQLERLAHLYNVPQWIFLKEQLPSQYRFRSIPSFRRFADASPVFDNYKVRVITTSDYKSYVNCSELEGYLML